MFANTPKPPYWAVIFTSHRAADEGYADTSKRMLELVAQQPGFLGVESARGADGVGITVSYWSDLESVKAWKAVEEHRAAQHRGRADWYSRYLVRICKVEREYGFER